MNVVDAQIHLWGSGLPSNAAHWKVTSFSTEELPWLFGRDLELVMGQSICEWWGWERAA